MPSESRADVRVVLVGRTGLDAALRLDPSIELLRAATPLEAIGELATPIDADSPGRAVVVVASRVEGLLEGTEQDAARAGDFVGAVRVASPGVVVLGVANGSPVPGAFDGALTPDAPAEALRSAMRWRPGLRDPSGAVRPLGGSPAQQSTPAPAPPRVRVRPEDELIGDLLSAQPATHAEVHPEPRPVTRPVASSSMPNVHSPSVPAGERAHDAPTDGVLVQLLLRGQDVQQAAIDLIRRRLNDDGVEFVASTGGPVPPRCVPVTWEGVGGVCYGHLGSARTPPEALAPHARWLASWLRLRDQHGQLREAAFTDSLTGAWNRRYFERFLRGTIEQAREQRRPVTILLFDIDDFKKYNDLYGHDAGDEILRETVNLLRSVIRPSDRVCRVGGDEFAVIFHEPEGPRQEGSRHPSDVFEIARRFQEQVLMHRFPKLLDCAPGTLTISGGLAAYPWDGATPEELLRRADQLAMASKRQGKNAITLGPGAMRLGGA